MAKLKIGDMPRRVEDARFLTGAGCYVDDIQLENMAHAVVLRSPHAHAEIKKIDTSKAEKLPGVKAVITSEDIPITEQNGALKDIIVNCMARDRALYDGHAVAAVAATDQETARRALKLIKVQYKKLPHVTDVDEAMKPGAPIVQPDVRTSGVQKGTEPTNVSRISQFGHGDVDAGFAKADVIVEKSYKTEQTHQGYIEPHACLASVGPDGASERWVTTQGPFTFRNVCASLLGLDFAKRLST